MNWSLPRFVARAEDVMVQATPAIMAPQSTTIGGAVRALEKSYQSMSRKRDDLEAQITALQEELRQTTVVVSSLEAALTVACADPALTAEEKDIADAAVSTRVAGAIDVEDLAPHV